LTFTVIQPGVSLKRDVRIRPVIPAGQGFGRLNAKWVLFHLLLRRHEQAALGADLEVLARSFGGEVVVCATVIPAQNGTHTHHDGHG